MAKGDSLCVRPVEIVGREEEVMLSMGHHAIRQILIDVIQAPQLGEGKLPPLQRGAGFASCFFLLRVAAGNEGLPQLPDAAIAKRYAALALLRPGLLENDFKEMYTSEDQPAVRALFGSETGGFSSENSRTAGMIVMALFGHLVMGDTCDYIYKRTFATGRRQRSVLPAPGRRGTQGPSRF